ncbi:LptF/LptG family permease [Candidatus Endowatersipora endosymbiont of Watersipora subatra]|uniref:LptF/LptG family permease n=1 Tax=Candidatus Endowatersipora endosymbiont of Watersipora subatra TaxID=3077946 RepID=UPI00312C92CA
MALLISLVWVIRAIQEVDLLLSKGQSILTYLQMTSLSVPMLTASTIPLALLIGLSYTINNLNNNSEMVAIHSTGLSQMLLVKPFLVLGLLTSLLVYTLHLWLGPISMATLRRFGTEVKSDLISVVIKEGRFQSVGKGLTFHVSSREPGGILKGVFIVDTRDPNETFTYLAKSGTIKKIKEEAFLVIKNGQIHHQIKNKRTISIIEFNSYAFNLSAFSKPKKSGPVSQIEISTFHLLNPEQNDRLFKEKKGDYRVELHSRLTGGLYPIVVTLLLLISAFRPHPRGVSSRLSLIVPTITCLFLRAITLFAEEILRTQPLMLFVVWGIPILSIFITAYSLSRR